MRHPSPHHDSTRPRPITDLPKMCITPRTYRSFSSRLPVAIALDNFRSGTRRSMTHTNLHKRMYRIVLVFQFFKGGYRIQGFTLRPEKLKSLTMMLARLVATPIVATRLCRIRRSRKRTVRISKNCRGAKSLPQQGGLLMLVDRT